MITLAHILLDIFVFYAGIKLVKMVFKFMSAGIDRFTDDTVEKIKGNRQKVKYVYLSEEDDDGYKEG